MPFAPTEPFRPAPGLASPHAQTLFAALFRSTRRPPLRRERWETDDGDFVDLDELPGAPASPHLLVLHGLEGSSRSGYIGAILRGAHQRGWGATALNFRSCSGEPNRLARSYHSGDTRDPRALLRALRSRHRGPLFAIGFSAGGNVLCRLLGETGEDAPVDAAVAISAPYDLDACARHLDAQRGFEALYRHVFLRSLKKKAHGKARRFPDAFDRRALGKARGLRAYDAAITAPLNGFPDVSTFYREASSGPLLTAIRRPTLLLSAEDDPIVPPPVVPAHARENPQLSVVTTLHGGHVGFVAGRLERPTFWAEAQALSFFDQMHAKT